MTLRSVGTELFYANNRAQKCDKATVAFHNFVNAPKKNNNSNEYQTNCFDLKALFLPSISMLDTVLYYGWLDFF